MSKQLDNAVREQYIGFLKEALGAAGEEVLVVGSNELAIPVVDAEGNDTYVVFTVKVPTGTRDGEAYDGHDIALQYKEKQELKAQKAKEAAEKKAKKAAADAEKRAARKAKKEE